MTEDNFEDFLKKAAQSYNAPPARTPRDDMWSAIQAQRAAGPHVIYGGGSLTAQTPARRFGSRIWIGAAAAAVLLLATGVGLGRWSARSTGPSATAVVRPPKAGSGRNAGDRIPETVVPGGTSVVASTQTGGAGGGEALPPREPLRIGGAHRPAAFDGTDGKVAVTAPSLNSTSNSTSNTGNSAYQITTVRHLSEAEALLTSFRTRSTTDQQMDAQLGSWARQLLSNTRLLLDSPVANDPQRRPLLEDLELVLVQIVQLSPGSTPQDREMIEKTLRQDHVMTRLRTAIPAGSQRGS
jgi:hypothetical protein